MALKSRIPEIIQELEPRMAAALETACDIVEARAKDRVPVDTGRLQRAIHTEFEVKRGQVKGYVVGGNNEAWYGHIVEHGSVNAPAHPFLVPALEESRSLVDEEIANVLRRL